MAKLYNLAKVTTPTTGTGTITLGSAVDGFLTFAQAGVQNGEEVTYAIKDGSNSEIGRGTYTSSGTTLTRSVLKSTNSDTAINLSGNAVVFITASAQDFDDKSDVTRQASVKTGNYTLALGDAGDVVIANSASSIDFTIPPNSSVAYPLYTQIDILTVNTGGVNIDPGSGVTLNGGTSSLELLAQYSAATIIKVGTDAWLMASVKSASTTQAGVVELATDAEVRAAASGKAFTTDLIESASALGTLTDASTVSVDWDAFINATLTAAGNRTIGNPTNVQPGTYRSFWIFGNNSTERAISWGSNFAGPLPEETVTSTKGLHITLHARTATSIDVFWKVSEP